MRGPSYQTANWPCACRWFLCLQHVAQKDCALWAERPKHSPQQQRTQFATLSTRRRECLLDCQDLTQDLILERVHAWADRVPLPTQEVEHVTQIFLAYMNVPTNLLDLTVDACAFRCAVLCVIACSDTEQATSLSHQLGMVTCHGGLDVSIESQDQM